MRAPPQAADTLPTVSAPLDERRVAPLMLGGIAVALLILGTLIAGTAVPLASSHFDSPIYLYHSKRYAETELAQSYLRHAEDIAEQVEMHRWPDTEGYPESFWRFMRFGNIAVLGGIIGSAADPLSGLELAGLAYGAMLAAAGALSFLLTLALLALLGIAPTRLLAAAAALSCLAWYASPIYRYLAGNFLSEAPALLLLSLGLLAWTCALLRQSAGLAAVAGVALVCVHTVRMESLWTALVFAALATLFVARRLPFVRLVRLLAVGVCAGAGVFAVWAALTWPLIDPRLVAELRAVLIARRPDVEPVYQAASVAGGLLWIGALASACSAQARRLRLFAFVLLALVLLPRANGLLAGTIHSRAMAELMLPLLLLSTVGLAAVLAPRRPAMSDLALRAGVAAAFVLGGLVIHPASYALLHSAPGLWRLQGVKNLLVPAHYERNAYDTAAARALAAVLYARGTRSVLIRDTDIRQEHLNVVRYFGPAYPHDADLALTPDPTNPRTCTPAHLDAALSYEPVLFCSAYEPGFLDAARARGWRLLYLGPAGEAAEVESSYVARPVLRAARYTLSALVPAAR